MTKSRTKAANAIAEANRLLRALEFSIAEGVYLQGELVAVSVAVDQTRIDGVMLVLVTCFMPGNLRVDWQGLALFLEANGGFSWLSFLDPAGNAIFKIHSHLTGPFRLLSSLSGAQVEERAAPVMLGDLRVDEVSGKSLEVESSDGRISARIEMTRDRFFADFTTRDASVARDKIWLECTDQHGETVRDNTTFRMRPDHLAWTARIEGQQPGGDELTFRFAALDHLTVAEVR